MSSLVYADDVVLLSWSASGLDSMNHFCLSLGLVISPTKTEVIVFNGPGLQTLGGLAPRFFPSLLASSTLA